jgi:hypothetical protein
LRFKSSTADAVALSTGTSVALSIADAVALSIADADAISTWVMLSRKEKHSPPTAYNVRVCIVYYYALFVCDFRPRRVKANSLENPG